MSTPPSRPSNMKSAFAPYRHALQIIATRTGSPLPSLLVSFGVLHELTAIVPLVGFFFGARALGVGERVVGAIQSDTIEWPGGKDSWVKTRCGEWIDEGKVWAEKVGRRYGVFGFEQRAVDAQSIQSCDNLSSSSADVSTRLVGDVANAILAYGLTKALIPVRVGFSLYLTPAFSRRVVEPVRLGVARFFTRRS